MTEETVLPAAYAPLEAVLELLSRPLAEVLRGQLLQFEPLAHRLERREFALQGEFEGLGGLTHHVAIDHILQSELLLRTEAPLEFLRRMAEAETLFHDRIYADPGARPVWRVVVSAGPDMLGHGRLVTLAALFFLARVAARRDAVFHWSFVPRAEGPVWFTGLSINAIKRFLRSAAFREAGVEDVLDVRAKWAEATGAAPSAGRPEVADWMIGALRDWGSDRSAIATEHNVFGFTFAPPIPDEPRRAAITVRRGGHLQNRATIELAPDPACLAALENPFPVPRREGASPQAGGHVPDMPGWERQYLSAPTGNYRAVRDADGILVMRVGVAGQNEGAWFLALPDDALLGGIAIQQDRLCVLHHRTRQGVEQLAYHRIALQPGRDQQASEVFVHAVPSQHLFRQQMPFALPSIGGHPGIAFHSVSGQSYELRFAERGETRFTSLPKKPRILLSQGSDHVLGQMQRNEFMVTVRKRDGSTVKSAGIGGFAHPPKRFHGIMWSPENACLAYALQAGEWRLLTTHLALDRIAWGDLDFRVEPCERVIGASTKNNGIHVQVWSDVRFGGSGAIETYRYSGGKRTRTSAPIELGEDAGRIAALQRVNGHFWAVTCDDQGAPQDLLLYLPKKRSGKTEVVRHPLARVRADAARLYFADEQ